MATPPAPVPPVTANSAPTPAQSPFKAPPFSQPPSTAGTLKTEIPPASSSAAIAAGVAAVGAAAEDSSHVITVPSYSGWFSYDSISDTERRLLPEFFEGEVAAVSGSRGPEAYKYYRNTLVKRFRARPARRLTLTEARRGLIGDVGSVRRVFDFLEEWGLINHGAPPLGAKQGKDKREEATTSQSSLPAGPTTPKKLCVGCRSVCGSAYFTCEKGGYKHML
uniref:SWIRM domain-containing protein n=1 Tax=Aegilops tauschii subsp. strangulata TaxID=200361 RepID=A0A453NN81_AEGTS